MLIAQRPAGKALAGAWEFPGGKLERGESRAAALARELSEEIGLSIRDPRPLVRLTHRYEHADVLLDVWVVRRYSGRLERRDAQSLRWVTHTELATVPLLPADRPILDLLHLPERLRQRVTRRYCLLEPDELAPPAGRRGGTAPLRGVLCHSPEEARAVRGADFLVLRERCAEPELAALCAALPIPVYAPALSLERAWCLGASGVQSIVW